MNEVVVKPERPEWVSAAISELRRVASAIDAQQAALTNVAFALSRNGATTEEISDALHDLSHAWRHVTAARRALVMVWPAEVDE
jgi:hypothetical protein